MFLCGVMPPLFSGLSLVSPVWLLVQTYLCGQKGVLNFIFQCSWGETHIFVNVSVMNSILMLGLFCGRVNFKFLARFKFVDENT